MDSTANPAPLGLMGFGMTTEPGAGALPAIEDAPGSYVKVRT